MATTSALLRAAGIDPGTARFGLCGNALLRYAQQGLTLLMDEKPRKKRRKKRKKASQDGSTFGSPLEECSQDEPDPAAEAPFPEPPTSTATEHASSSTPPPASSATEHASTSTPHFVLEDEYIEKIASLLVFMSRDFLFTMTPDDVYNSALDVILNQAQADQALESLNTASLAKLSRLIDIMIAHDDGTPKDPNDTLAFMRRCAQVRDEIRPTWSDNATEHVELNENDVSLCYKQFGRSLLENDLLAEQWYNEKYWLRYKFPGDMYLTTFQRSFVDNLLRKKLGDKKVAVLIWQRGLPSIADRPVSWQRGLPSKELDKITLKSCLDECLQWYINLANAIVVHRNQKGFRQQLSASSLDGLQKQQHKMRRKALQEARTALRRGATLADQRDNRKRTFEDMNDAEQNNLEDYETGRARKAKQRFSTTRIKAFRSNTEIS